MNTGSWQIRLSWNDPVTGEKREPTLTPPIAFGRDMAQMPQTIQGNPIRRMLINDSQISRYHALIDIVQGQLVVIDQGSGNGTYINNVRQTQTVLASGDRLRIGNTEIEVNFNQPSGSVTQSFTQPVNLTNSRQVRLRWEEPATGEQQENIFIPPIGFGREAAAMPTTIEANNRLILNSEQVSRYHALIDWQNDQLVVTDQKSTNHIFINGVQQQQAVLATGDTLQIGPYQITVGFGNSTATQISFRSSTILHAAPTPTASGFPPNSFLQTQQVVIQDLHATGHLVDQTEYAAVGAGLGSFFWVDLLRISGVKKEQIVALGLQPQPYARYKQLCENSQIPAHERLRSNSDSCPDNIWGWPSYAWREAWHEFRQGKVNRALKLLWQVFVEPDLIETYTPKSGNVFASIDREANRIGWESIYRYGSVRGIRKTDDGRYAIAYSAGGGKFAFLVAKYVHLATGYPAIRFLDDLQDYRQRTGDLKSVVNAYEPHNHVYEHLEKHGGVVMLRGRGIVASRIIQRIYEIRRDKGQKVSILHLLRSPLSKGHKFELAQRTVKYHQEFQPFNWPKACWGGDLRAMLEKATPTQRQKLLNDWGGTTTADRRDWQYMVQKGFDEGWYKIEFGEVAKVEPNQPHGTITYIKAQQINGEMKLQADFIIDATGLDAKVQESSLLNDLQTTYNLELNFNGRLAVKNDFELEGMRNQKGKMYAAGAITLGGPYAAVDSFLGLQFAALQSIDSLVAVRASGVKYLNGLNSLGQWCKWAMNQSP